MRIFIAVEFEEAVKEYIYEKQQEVKKEAVKGNFSNKENFHLTLHFIGEADQKKIETIKKVINEAVHGVDPFTLELGNLGHFPRKNKHILWLGVEKGKKTLVEFVDKLRQILKDEGFNIEDQSYRPHITICREVILNQQFADIQRSIIVNPKEIEVTHISLMESVRIEGQLVYRPIYQKALEG